MKNRIKTRLDKIKNFYKKNEEKIISGYFVLMPSILLLIGYKIGKDKMTKAYGVLLAILAKEFPKDTFDSLLEKDIWSKLSRFYN